MQEKKSPAVRAADASPAAEPWPFSRRRSPGEARGHPAGGRSCPAPPGHSGPRSPWPALAGPSRRHRRPLRSAPPHGPGLPPPWMRGPARLERRSPAGRRLTGGPPGPLSPPGSLSPPAVTGPAPRAPPPAAEAPNGRWMPGGGAERGPGRPRRRRGAGLGRAR